ncbi:MAG TPA: copper-binding protein [Candidatus Polarisedimenticolaceae bacterium]|nr:copper-binding protein [Candidatus Polarisedimenticolaceae bacterium]
MNSVALSVGTVFLALSACAAYELQPLGMDHPANPRSMSAPAASPSKTLAYSRNDIPSVVAAASQQENHDSYHQAGETNGQKTVVAEGKVIATLPAANQVVVEHGEIKGFMEPMTMGYRIEPASLLEGLKSGDQVRFTIDVPNKTIVKIEKIK